MTMRKRILALLLALIMLLGIAGCDGAASKNGGTAADNITVYEERLVSELSMLCGDSVVFEHRFGTSGKLDRTDVRYLRRGSGLVIQRFVYAYDDEGDLAKIEMYAINDDADIAMDAFTSKFTHSGTIEITKTDTGFTGTLFEYDNGSWQETDEEIAVVFRDGNLVSAIWKGFEVTYDENGKKISERCADEVATFTYDDAGNMTEMRIADEGEQDTVVTMECDTNGYVKHYTATDPNPYGSMKDYTVQINAEGFPVSIKLSTTYPQEEGSSVIVETQEIEYVAPGRISNVRITEKRGDKDYFLNHAVTYNDQNLPATRISEEGRNGKVNDRDEYVWTYNEKGLVSNEMHTNYREEDGTLALYAVYNTDFTYDESGKLIKKHKVNREAPEETNTATYTYNADGRLAELDQYETLSEGGIWHCTDQYEYHANGRKSKHVEIYCDDQNAPESKYVRQYNEKGDIITVTNYGYIGGAEVLKYTEEYTHVHEQLGYGHKKTTTEIIRYDSENNPVTKTTQISERTPLWGKSCEGDIYDYVDGQWVKRNR